MKIQCDASSYAVGGVLLQEDKPGVRFTTRCRALTAGLSLTLNLTTNSTIPVSQPLSCVSLSCANLSLSLTLQISQWSSSIETTSSDYRFSGVNRELQVLNVSGFIKFKSKHQSFSQADHIKIPKRWKYNMPRHKEVFVAVFCFEEVALASIVSPLTSQCCTSPRASAGCQRSAPMT